jgi:hypothetical protein
MAYQNLRMADLGSFLNCCYWTSSEMGGIGIYESANAYVVDFSIPQQYFFGFKRNLAPVRAIRSF